jgi:hypothetical protein
MPQARSCTLLPYPGYLSLWICPQHSLGVFIGFWDFPSILLSLGEQPTLDLPVGSSKSTCCPVRFSSEEYFANAYLGVRHFGFFSNSDNSGWRLVERSGTIVLSASFFFVAPKR